jgi:hypothetical protein
MQMKCGGFFLDLTLELEPGRAGAGRGAPAQTSHMQEGTRDEKAEDDTDGACPEALFFVHRVPRGRHEGEDVPVPGTDALDTLRSVVVVTVGALTPRQRFRPPLACFLGQCTGLSPAHATPRLTVWHWWLGHDFDAVLGGGCQVAVRGALEGDTVFVSGFRTGCARAAGPEVSVCPAVPVLPLTRPCIVFGDTVAPALGSTGLTWRGSRARFLVADRDTVLFAVDDTLCEVMRAGLVGGYYPSRDTYALPLGPMDTRRGLRLRLIHAHGLSTSWGGP